MLCREHEKVCRILIDSVQKKGKVIYVKILMIPSWYCTKSAPILGSFYKEQAEELAARGHDVAVIYAEVGGSFSPKVNGVTHAVINGVNTYTYVRPNLTPRFEKGRAWQRTKMLEYLYKKLVKEWGRPDVVNLRSSLQGYEAVALCKKYHLPLFFMEHSSFVVTEGAGSAAVKRLQTVMATAKVNACVSSVLMNVMKPFDENTRLIPDFVDERRFYVGEKNADIDTFVFAAMGQLRPIKGHDTLIRAFARLRQLTDRKVVLRIAGTGGLKEYLQGIIDENNKPATSEELQKKIEDLEKQLKEKDKKINEQKKSLEIEQERVEILKKSLHIFMEPRA